MIAFVPGLELCQGFYRDAVAPILGRHFPKLRYSAGLLGPGSEVLGYDDAVSTDHHWGPRVELFLEPRDRSALAGRIEKVLADELPHRFRGFPTSFSDPNAEGTRLLEERESGPVAHRVTTHTIDDFVGQHLAVEWRGGLTARDWLSFPSQVLRSLTAGELYRDDLDLASVQAQLTWYPDPVWRYLLAAGWMRIGQEQPFVGRTGQAGDELGSRILATRLVRDVMRLAFLMERVHAPYAKWFGRAFSELAGAPRLSPFLEQVLAATDWIERDRKLAGATSHLATMHNSLGITPEVPRDPQPFFGRPFSVIDGERIARSLLESLDGPEATLLRARRPIGSIDQFSDSTDLGWPVFRSAIRGLYGPEV